MPTNVWPANSSCSAPQQPHRPLVAFTTALVHELLSGKDLNGQFKTNDTYAFLGNYYFDTQARRKLKFLITRHYVNLGLVDTTLARMRTSIPMLAHTIRCTNLHTR